MLRLIYVNKRKGPEFANLLRYALFKAAFIHFVCLYELLPFINDIFLVLNKDAFYMITCIFP